jgi:predicted nucleotidyltransferase
MIDRFGLKEGDLALIINVLNSEPAVSEAYIFGSRASGKFSNGSDIDIALKGITLNLGIVTRLSYLLNEELSLPYFFDLVDYNTIKATELKDHIDRVGIKIL